MSNQEWYTPIINTEGSTEVFPSAQNSSIFEIAIIQYIVLAIVYSVSKPYKEPIYNNFILTGYIILLIGFSYYIVIEPDRYTSEFLTVNYYLL